MQLSLSPLVRLQLQLQVSLYLLMYQCIMLWGTECQLHLWPVCQTSIKSRLHNVSAAVNYWKILVICKWYHATYPPEDWILQHTAHSTPKPKLPVFLAHVGFFFASLLSVKFLTFTSPVLDGRPRFLLVSSWGAASLSDMMPVTDTQKHVATPEQTSWSNSLYTF
jgi:hypothetical protein